MKGQIVKIISNLYSVSSNNRIYECRARGKFRNDKIIPTVGDYVEFDEVNNYILKVEPRRNTLIRPLVSNIDQAFIVTSLKNPDFSDNLLDKLLVVLEFNKIKPIICLTKNDLLSRIEKKELKTKINYYKKIGYKVVYNHNLFKIKRLFKNKTTVFTGQTGAGKSTLLNKLNKKLNLQTGEISKALGRGKHTTRHVELIEMCKGKVLDTPGFSMIDFNEMSKEDIRNSFIEFNKCKCDFRNCMHLNEKKCSVKDAVDNGDILKSRYDNYKKFIDG